MAVAAESALELEPDRERARELARDHNAIPVACRFVEDTETPVSAFLKLRGAGPSFLLESAEQGGRQGRYSFLGFRPRAVLRWSGGTLSEWTGELDAGSPPSATHDAPDPYAAVSEYLDGLRVAPVEGLPPFAGGAVGFFGFDLVRTVEPLAEPNPDPLGLPDMALMITDTLVCFDHQRHELTVLAHAYVDGPDDVDEAFDRAVATIEDVRAKLREPVPASPRRSSADAEPVGVRVEHDARAVRVQRQPHHRVHPRRRRLPGRPVAALLGPGARRGVLDLPRPAHGQPLALHVLPRVRRLPDRRRVARAAAQGHRPARRDAPDRGHLPARRRRGRGPPPRRGAARRPQGARRARDARRPRPQRPRAGERVRHRRGRGADGGRDLLARPAHRQPGLGDASRGRHRDGRTASHAAGGHAVGRAQGARDADHRRARAPQARRRTAARSAT